MTLKTVVSFLAVAFLILIDGFSLNLQIDQSLNLSIPFGNTSTVNIPQLPLFSQSMAIRMWGNISSLFYIDGEINGTAFDRFTLDYLPANIRLGTVPCLLPNESALSVFGISSAFFTAGQIRGVVKTEDFLADKEDEEYVLGSILPGSLDVYVNGVEISSDRYDVNYEMGSLEVKELKPGDVVSVRYQSPEGSQGYVANLKRKIKLSSGELSFDILGTFFENSEYYLFSRFAGHHFELSTYFDVGNALCAYSKLTTWMMLGDFKSSFSLEGKSAGFHEPFETPQSADISFSLKGTSGNATLIVSGNSHEIGTSFKAKNTSFSAKIGSQENLNLNLSKGPVSFGTVLGKNLNTFYFGDSTASETLWLSVRPSGKYDLSLQTFTFPAVTFNSNNTGNSLKLSYKNIELSFENGKSTNLGIKLSGNAFPFMKYIANITLGNATSSLYLSSDIQTTFGKFSASLEASSNSITLSGSFSRNGMSAGFTYANSVFKSNVKVGVNLFEGWHADLSVIAGISKNGFGGSVNLDIWRKDF